MKINKIALSVVLAASMTFSACGKTEEKAADIGKNGNVTEEKKTETVEGRMGRYREEEVVFPKTVKSVFDIKTNAEGITQVLCEGEPGSLYLFESSDAGKTWESKLEVEAGGLPNGYRAADACLRPDGRVFLSAGEMSENLVRNKQAVGKYAYYNVAYAEGKAEIEEVTLALPEMDGDYTDFGYGLRDLQITEDNLLVGNLSVRVGEAGEANIYCINLDDGSVKWTEKAVTGDFTLYEDVLYLNDFERTKDNKGYMIRMADVKTGETTGKIMFPAEMGLMDSVHLNPAEKRMVYATPQGIFTSDYEMTLNERLVNGEFSGISENEYKISRLSVLKENAFMVILEGYYGNGRMKCYRYEYDENLSAVPEKQVTVYSLKRNEVMEKMLFDFRKEHPEMLVEYEVGMQGAGVQTVSDAINALNTKIMAGDGPDLLVLNSLPWESYSEKGILKDVGSEISAKIENGEVFENMFKAYQREDSWYAVPVSFKVPIVLGREETVNGINSLESLTEAALQSEGIPAFDRTDEALLLYTASVYWSQVQGEDGSISRDALKNLLEQTKAMNDGVKSSRQEEFDQTYENAYEHIMDYPEDIFALDTSMDTGSIEYDMTSMFVGYLSCMNNYVGIYNEDMTAKAVSEGVFSPLLVGINGKADDMENAKALLDFMLSKDEQGIFAPGEYPLTANLPVNKQAFTEMTKEPSKEIMAELGKTNAILGKPYIWPSEEDFKTLEANLETLSIPAMEDNLVIQTVLDSGMPYLKGEKDLDTAASEISQKLELNFAE